MVQLFLGASAAWGTIALNSVRTSGTDSVLLPGVCFQRLLQILVFAALMLPMFLIAFISEYRALGYIVLAVVLCCGILLGEFLRRYFIRLGLLHVSMVFAGIRWVTTIVVLAICTKVFVYNNLALPFICLILGISAASLITTVLIRAKRIDVTVIRNQKLSKAVAQLAWPLLGDNLTASGSGIVIALTVTSLLDRASYGGYAAILALAGGFAVIVQLIDMHYSSSLLNRPINPKKTLRLQDFCFVAAVCCSILLFHFRQGLIMILLGPTYLPYADLLPIAGLQCSFQAMNQIALTQLRILGKHKAYIYKTVIRIFGISLIPVAILIFRNIESVAVLMVAVPVFQWIVARQILSVSEDTFRANSPEVIFR